MMRILLPLVVLVGVTASAAAEPPKVLATGLDGPSGVAIGPGGRIYVTVTRERDKQGTGAVMRIDNGKAAPFATGLDAPLGIAVYQNWLFIADNHRVWRIDAKGKADVFAPASAFPAVPHQLTGIAADPESGTLFVCDYGDENEQVTGAIYRISPKGTVSLVSSAKTLPQISRPLSLLLDGQSHLLVGSELKEEVHRIKLANSSIENLGEGLFSGTGLAWDQQGRLFICDHRDSRISVIPRPGEKSTTLTKDFRSPAAISLDASGKNLLVAVTHAGTLHTIPISIPGWEVDVTPMPLQTAVAFPDLKWEGWKGETDSGKMIPQRPIVLTHAGDGSNRVFVATEQGVIHVFLNDQKAAKAPIFLDIQDRVSYNDNQNEEGFLGLAFHPKYKNNGEFFVYYTTKKAKLTNVLSRFRVRKDDPNKADPASEEEIMRFTKPFWNHDGGTLCFGPDGYLYLTHGDGGAGGDPHDNAQNLNSMLGKIHRINVDQKSKSFNYSIPPDNPFVGRTDARPEIWAYGLRNVWRMAFDRETHKLWAADVGQNLYEEIDLIEKGANYGWNRREGLHPFGPKGTGPKPEFIDPIWEYHHDVGKSIIGGHVYRGPRLPELTGHYIYGDHVTGRIWALRYDEAKKRVVANRPIKDKSLPMFSFGEDEKGEVYMLTPTLTGQGIFWFGK